MNENNRNQDNGHHGQDGHTEHIHVLADGTVLHHTHGAHGHQKEWNINGETVTLAIQ